LKNCSKRGFRIRANVIYLSSYPKLRFKGAEPNFPTTSYQDLRLFMDNSLANTSANKSFGDKAGTDRSAPPPILSQGDAGKEKSGAMEVIVEHNIEKALKLLKRKLIKEGMFRELKARRYYEKPSERKKRKLKESLKKIRKDQARSRKNSSLLV
jgi:small subunit ribosomal protein S21